MTVRAQSIPARHYFPEHAHGWNQVVYAISGVLTVTMEGRSFAISPEEAVWLPTGLSHRVGSLLGAEFRSLWIADEAGAGLPNSPTVFSVSPLLQALIVEAAEIERQEDRDGYTGRVVALILDQLRRARALPGALPWPRCHGRAADPSPGFAKLSMPTLPILAGRRRGAGSLECRNVPWPAASKRSWA
jgi:hypothetical protein